MTKPKTKRYQSTMELALVKALGAKTCTKLHHQARHEALRIKESPSPKERRLRIACSTPAASLRLEQQPPMDGPGLRPNPVETRIRKMVKR